MNSLDIFCGVGGLSYGFEQAGIEVIAGVDFDEDVIETYEKNHTAKGIVEDLGNLSAKDFAQKYGITPAQVQVIGGGPPCQGYSTANQNTGDDERNDLIFTFAEYVEHFKPRYFVMENVVGILSDDRFEEFLKYLEGIGYDVAYENMLASNHGVPQRRRRIITVGCLEGDAEDILMRVGTSEEITVQQAIGDLPELEAGEVSDVDSHEAVNHRSDSLERIELVPEGGDMGDIPEEYQLKSYDPQRHAHCYGRLRWDEPAYTITKGFTRPGSGKFIHPSQDRALTPREAARLQSFPDDFEFADGTTQAAKEIGNAVPPKLAEKIADQIILEESLTSTFAEAVAAGD